MAKLNVGEKIGKDYLYCYVTTRQVIPRSYLQPYPIAIIDKELGIVLGFASRSDVKPISHVDTPYYHKGTIKNKDYYNKIIPLLNSNDADTRLLGIQLLYNLVKKHRDARKTRDIARQHK